MGLAARHAVPTMYHFRDFVAAGGLVATGSTLSRYLTYRQIRVFAGRILGGAKPAELPVLQPTKFEFVINLKTAQAIGVDLPTSLLLRADEVIE